MAGTLGVVTGVGILRSGITLLARIRGQDGRLITQASLSSITFTVRDVTTSTTITSAQALTISSVIFDSLQQSDPRWDKDDADNLGSDGSHGYNFRATIPASNFTAVDVDSDPVPPAPDRVTAHRFQCDVKFTPASGEAFFQPFSFTGIPVYGT